MIARTRQSVGYGDVIHCLYRQPKAVKTYLGWFHIVRTDR